MMQTASVNNKNKITKMKVPRISSQKFVKKIQNK